MANPQLENGHTKIANEILEHLMKIHLSSNQWQILLCIIRKTYGFHKKVDHIANFQICEATGLCKAVVSRALSELENLGTIRRRGKFIGFQKDWEKWGELAESSTLHLKLAEQLTNESLLNSQQKLAESSTELAESSTKVSSPAVAQKKKETIQKKKETDLFKGYSTEFQETFLHFIEMRKFIKKPITVRGIELALIKLETLASSDEGKIAIINQSIVNSWQGLFPLAYSKGGFNGKIKGKLPTTYKTAEEQ